jgi:hypothetical protein
LHETTDKPRWLDKSLPERIFLGENLGARRRPDVAAALACYAKPMIATTAALILLASSIALMLMAME